MNENIKTEDEKPADYDNGQWYAVTLGKFIGLLVDAGQDPAVCFKVVLDGEPDSNGNFLRQIEMVLVPDGRVNDMVIHCDHIHKILKEMLDKNIIT